MVCIRVLDHVLCFTRDVTVEDVIMKYMWTWYQGVHDENAVIDTKSLVSSIVHDFPQFSRVDVVQGIIQLVYEGRLCEVYPNEYKINEDWG